MSNDLKDTNNHFRKSVWFAAAGTVVIAGIFAVGALFPEYVASAVEFIRGLNNSGK